MTQYINTDFKIGASVFTNLEDPKSNTAAFNATLTNVRVGNTGATIPMVKGKVVLRTEADASVCGETCPIIINESVAVEFNLQRGAASLAQMRSEVVRLMDKAIADYGFSAGHVPPSSANFNGV